MRQQPEDFLVDEVPAYLPSGKGVHLYVHFEKRDLTTPAAVSALGRALAVPASRCSYAGLKDRHAVTRQWASFEGADPDRLRNVDIPNLNVLEHGLHTNKLKTGHLRANKFRIRVRNPAGDAGVAENLLSHLAATGCPNYYGEQRFGRDGDNAEAAFAFVSGAQRPPRDRFQRKLLFSAFQSALFNSWLADRVQRGELAQAIGGDLMRKEDTGGLFTSEDLNDLQARTAQFAISATGPMFGADMRSPVAEALAREQELLATAGVSYDMLVTHKKLGSGTRRVCRIRPEHWSVDQEGSDLVIAFTLPRGSYATVVMRELMKDELT